MCHTCLHEVPARVVIRGGEARLEKECPEHGISFEVLSRSPDYWRELDNYYFAVNSEDYAQRDYLVRMTETCNLDCPICLAKANTEDTPDLDLSGLERLLSEKRRIKVDLMAAEPTVRKDLEDWVRKVKAKGHLCALHTNGIRLADLDFARRIKAAGVDEVFLQFDGFDDEAHKVLRGRPLLEIRSRALANLREVGLATSLIVVIARGLNERAVGEVFHFAMKPEHDHIREVFYLGLRVLGSARDAIRTKGSSLAEMALMPDETLQMLVEQVPGVRREDVKVFNKLYFALLSAFKVKKCLYVQHYLVARDGKGGFRAFSDLVDMVALERAADRYARLLPRHPHLARAGFLASLSLRSLTRGMVPLLSDMARMQLLLRVGMNLDEVPRRLVILGFITACDPQNFDAAVAVNCGKGELSVDGGFVDSGAVANVRREARFDQTDRRPGRR
jgi:pyruvate-formate lyase-activating enzyme